MNKLYKEYISNQRSILLTDMRQAEAFVEYLQSINHKIVNKLVTRYSKSMGVDVVHVCEPLYFERG